MMNLDELTVKVSMDTSGVPAGAAGATRGLEAMTAAAAVGNRQFAALGNQSKLTAQQMQQVSYQVNDFAVQVLSGQSAVTALIQQGSQLSGTFGGVGGALRALGGIVLSTTGAIGAVIAAIAGVGFAFNQARERATDFARNIALTGNAAGQSFAGLRVMALQVAAQTKLSESAAYDLATAYAYSGKVGPDSLEAIVRVVARLSQVSGRSADDVRKEFDGLFDKPAAAALKLNERYNFLTADIAKMIVKLEEQGKKEQAAILVSEQLDKTIKARSESIKLEVGLWERLGTAASNAYQKLTTSFDDASSGDRLATLRSQLALQEKALEIAQNSRGSQSQASIAGRKQAIETLREQIESQRELTKLQGQSAQADLSNARRNQTERSKVSAILGDAGKKKADPKRDFLNEGLDKLDEDLRQRLEKVLDSEDQASAKLLEKDIDTYRRRSEAGRTFGEQLSDQAAAISVSLIQDQQARGLAQIQLEKGNMMQRLEALQLEGDEYSRIWSGIQDYVAARNAQLTEELKPEWQRQLDAWRDTNRLMRDSFNDFQAGWLREGEDAWVRFAQTGKLSVSSLVDFAIAEFARMQFRQSIAPAFSGAGQGIAGFIGSLLGVPSASYSNEGRNYPVPVASAAGNVFGPGGVQAFARGGIMGINGGLLTRPTVFPMANGGIGLGGEAGTEAVMPLQRTSSGKLGVIAAGMGAMAPQVNVQVNNLPGQAAKVTSQRNRNGGTDLIIQITEAVKAEMISDVQNGGTFGSALQNQYGVNRAQGLVR